MSRGRGCSGSQPELDATISLVLRFGAGIGDGGALLTDPDRLHQPLADAEARQGVEDRPRAFFTQRGVVARPAAFVCVSDEVRLEASELGQLTVEALGVAFERRDAVEAQRILVEVEINLGHLTAASAGADSLLTEHVLWTVDVGDAARIGDAEVASAALIQATVDVGVALDAAHVVATLERRRAWQIKRAEPGDWLAHPLLIASISLGTLTIFGALRALALETEEP